MPTGLAVHEHEIGRALLLRDFQRGAHVRRVAGIFIVVICAMALAGCVRTTRSSTISQTVDSKKVTKHKNFWSKSRMPISALPLISQTANHQKVTESNKFTERKSKTAISLPAAPLLSPQLEPSCEFETGESKIEERQKLDYERQCYRHAEMIVRSRLQLLQDSVDKTISALKRTPTPLPAAPLPAAPLLSPQPEPSCDLETPGSSGDERQKLDYERQCYRHAEMIVRSRLQLLQDSVDKTIDAVKRSERGGL
jgi:hypothetical protein